MPDQCRILLIGLDNAGKSTLCARILEHFGQKYEPKILPTIGFSTSVFEQGHKQYVIFDLGGSGRFRGLWRQYIDGADIVLIVVDSDDKDTFYVCRDELRDLMSQTREGNQKFVLVFNKIDIEQHVPAEKIAKFINADSIFKGRSRFSVSVSALCNQNLDEVFALLK